MNPTTAATSSGLF